MNILNINIFLKAASFEDKGELADELLDSSLIGENWWKLKIYLYLPYWPTMGLQPKVRTMKYVITYLSIQKYSIIYSSILSRKQASHLFFK